MILLENPEKYAENQEVDAYSLTNLTQEGWTVIALLSAQTTDSTQNSKPRYDRDGHQLGTDYVDETFVISQPRYLIGKTRDKVLEELREERRGLKDTSDHHESRADNLGIRVEDLKKDVASKEKCIERQVESKDKAVRARDDADDRSRKMEGDLGKLRQALGDIKFKEIIEA